MYVLLDSLKLAVRWSDSKSQKTDIGPELHPKKSLPPGPSAFHDMLEEAVRKVRKRGAPRRAVDVRMRMRSGRDPLAERCQVRTWIRRQQLRRSNSVATI